MTMLARDWIFLATFSVLTAAVTFNAYVNYLSLERYEKVDQVGTERILQEIDALEGRVRLNSDGIAALHESVLAQIEGGRGLVEQEARDARALEAIARILDKRLGRWCIR
jgi:hypothetical protein